MSTTLNFATALLFASTVTAYALDAGYVFDWLKRDQFTGAVNLSDFPEDGAVIQAKAKAQIGKKASAVRNQLCGQTPAKAKSICSATSDGYKFQGIQKKNFMAACLLEYRHC